MSLKSVNGKIQHLKKNNSHKTNKSKKEKVNKVNAYSLLLKENA